MPMLPVDTDRQNGGENMTNCRRRELRAWSIVLAGILSCLACGSPPAGAAGPWLPVSDRTLVRDSDLIATGRIVWLEEIPGTGRMKARIMISEVLKDDPRASHPLEMVSLVFDSPRENPAALHFDMDQEGIWFLQRAEGAEAGVYEADHPARFKPLMLLAQVRKAISEAGAR